MGDTTGMGYWYEERYWCLYMRLISHLYADISLEFASLGHIRELLRKEKCHELTLYEGLSMQEVISHIIDAVLDLLTMEGPDL